MSSGKLVVIEGVDYAGKTTFVNYLRTQHPEYVYSREPGGCATSERVRDLLLSEEGKTIDPLTRFHLFWASRAENIEKVIRPALEAGKVAVTDRFDASTYGFQIGGDEEVQLEQYFWETRRLHLQGLNPIYLFFTVPASVTAERKEARVRESNHFDRRDSAYHARVAEYYARFFSNPAVEHKIVFDANRQEDSMIAAAYMLFQRMIE